MFKKILVALIAIAAIAFTVYYLMRSPESAPAPTPTPTATAPAPTPSPASSPTPTTTAPVPETPTTTTPAVPAPEEPSPTSPSSYRLPVIDATWRTYANRALSFEFKWPTKGKYAPIWEVTFSDKNVCDDYAANGGVAKKTLDVNGASFCHVQIDDSATGHLYMTDKYVTQKGSKYIVITFEKQVVRGAFMENPKCSAEWSLNSKSCIPFDLDEYRAHLDQIVGTFKYTD